MKLIQTKLQVGTQLKIQARILIHQNHQRMIMTTRHQQIVTMMKHQMMQVIARTVDNKRKPTIFNRL